MAAGLVVRRPAARTDAAPAVAAGHAVAAVRERPARALREDAAQRVAGAVRVGLAGLAARAGAC